MERLINLYDNFLIYYPNVFFSAISVVGILILVFIIKFIFSFSKKIKIIFKEIGNDSKQVRIKKIKFQKIYIVKFSTIKMASSLLKFIIKNIVIVLSSVNTFFKYLEKRILKLVRAIGKEILID